METKEPESNYWRDRALVAELEVRDLLKENQRLRYLIDELNFKLSSNNSDSKRK